MKQNALVRKHLTFYDATTSWFFSRKNRVGCREMATFFLLFLLKYYLHMHLPVRYQCKEGKVGNNLPFFFYRLHENND